MKWTCCCSMRMWPLCRSVLEAAEPGQVVDSEILRLLRHGGACLKRVECVSRCQPSLEDGYS